MTKRLIVCADGTWASEDRACAPTNVVKLYRALCTEHVEGVPQLVYYQSGVGTEWGERLKGGAFGFGLSRNIRECYAFLVDNYEPGDELYFFGFSRGAYTVRSLAGLIRNAGIVSERAHIDRAFTLYRSRRAKHHPSREAAVRFREKHAKGARPRGPRAEVPEVRFIGVWDTVGSLGYPLPFFRAVRPLLELLGLSWWFHDTKLGNNVLHAYHALAIHERRSDFQPTLWSQQLDASGQPQRASQVLEQVWFPGTHSDVGGGHFAAGLSDLTLSWMIEKATRAGLAFRPSTREFGAHHAPDPTGRLHDSFTGIFAALDFLRGRFHGRPRTFSFERPLRQSIAPAVLQRRKAMPSSEWPPQGGTRSFRSVIGHASAASERPPAMTLEPPPAAHPDPSELAAS
ncbi:MAG: DUF2235 domain-containing protein [Polyangiales bacterium]